MENLVEIQNVCKKYLSKENAFSKNIIETNAVDNVSFNIKKAKLRD